MTKIGWIVNNPEREFSIDGHLYRWGPEWDKLTGVMQKPIPSVEFIAMERPRFTSALEKAIMEDVKEKTAKGHTPEFTLIVQAEGALSAISELARQPAKFPQDRLRDIRDLATEILARLAMREKKSPDQAGT